MVLIRDNLLCFRLRTTRYAHALPSRTPKDTLLTLNTLPEPSHDDSLLVLGLVLRHSASHPFSRLAVAGTGIRFRCALPNQFRCQTSISLAFAKKPALGRWKPAGTVSKDWAACPLVGVASKYGGDQETSNESGGAERDRTADLMLAKHALSQLSYSPKSGCLRLRWWAWVDSNYRPHPYQGCALTN